MIDLHIHTNFSDGTLSPTEVVRRGAQMGLKALAVTDHDTVAGVEEAVRAASGERTEVIAGVELSADWRPGILHILGYFLDTGNELLRNTLDELKRARLERTPKILAKLDELGVRITQEEVDREAGAGVPGRPHIARVLVSAGYVSNLQEAFDRYLRRGALAYVEKAKLPPNEAIRLLREAGGVPVLAHPYSLEPLGPVGMADLIRDLREAGLEGIEAYYPEHSPEQTGHYLEIAGMFDLTVTGGTDFHGANKPGVGIGVIPGAGPLPYSVVENLKERRDRVRTETRPSGDSARSAVPPAAADNRGV